MVAMTFFAVKMIVSCFTSTFWMFDPHQMESTETAVSNAIGREIGRDIDVTTQPCAQMTGYLHFIADETAYQIYIKVHCCLKN